MEVSRAGRGTILVLLQNFIQFGLGLLFFAVAANILSKADIGLISTFNFISILFFSVAPLSLHVAATRFMASYIGQNDKEQASSVAKSIKRLVLYSSLIILIVSIASTFIYIYISNLFSLDLPVQLTNRPDLILFVLVYAFFLTMRTTYQGFLQGLQKFERYALVGVISITLARILGIF